ncbi:type II secretion system protein [Planococcus sp. CPCC 101016]|uniref:type IV pilus modification PilV family protein n=1 Tax=Planococcus sp. CPCC 101016 TaxID=2599617 RepID=UPI0011B5B8C9|nr:type II secretion system protein [Planococcus sp. CPCC 101016]TWT08388.1 type II secretion system protein [Planococcus sp. CPCC 101016]
MKIIRKNEKGLTLVEILAALVILGIVLVSFMSFFTQSAKFTTYNYEKLTAVQVAEDVISNVREKGLVSSDYRTRYPQYTIEIVSSNGPTPNLKRAIITVKSAQGTRSKQPEFKTEMYYEVPDE